MPSSRGSSWPRNRTHISPVFCIGRQVLYQLAPPRKPHLSYRLELKIKWKYMSIIDRMSEWVSEVAQSCPTLCDPMDCSLPGSSLHGILQARVLEWVAISSPGDLPDPGIKPGSPAFQADALTSEPPGKHIPFHKCELFLLFSLMQSVWTRRVVRAFPGGPVAKTLHSQCRGLGSVSDQGTSSHMLQLKSPRAANTWCC